MVQVYVKKENNILHAMDDFDKFFNTIIPDLPIYFVFINERPVNNMKGKLSCTISHPPNWRLINDAEDCESVFKSI